MDGSLAGARVAGAVGAALAPSVLGSVLSGGLERRGALGGRDAHDEGLGGGVHPLVHLRVHLAPACR